MYKVVTACIDQVIRFEDDFTFKESIRKLEQRKQQYNILDKQIMPDGACLVRVQRQYNNSPMPEGGEEFDEH